MHGQQRMTQVHRKKDDRLPEAEEKQGVDIIGTKKSRGKGINRNA